MFGNMMGGFWPGSYGMMYGGGFMGILFLLLIGIGIYLLLKNNRPLSTTSISKTNTNNEALEIAKLRYVRGEITFEEYQEIEKVINN